MRRQRFSLHEPPSTQRLAEIRSSKLLTALGDGDDQHSKDYLTMLGITPAVVGQSCPGAPFNSADCPEWAAIDGGTFFVSSESYMDEPSADNCEGCSMEYAFHDPGVLAAYTVVKGIGNTGFKSPKFFCDIGDKMP